VNDRTEVIVIGAGISGLAAAARLAESGLSATILEARNRFGGRIFTTQDSYGLPIELGAEFIHGRPPEILTLLSSAGIEMEEVEGDAWCANGRLQACDYFSKVQDLLGRMSDQGPDECFLEFLEKVSLPGPPGAAAEVKQRSLNFVSGFNAADPARVGVHWLVKTMRADEDIEGERAFRPKGGYAELLSVLLARLKACDVAVRTGTVVTRVRWQRGNANVSFQNSEGSGELSAPRVLITLPLGVLKAKPGSHGQVQFDPQLPEAKLGALERMEMGEVARVVFRFRHRFWERIVSKEQPAKSLRNMSFLFSQDEWFPTWWTTLPRESPVITGWAPPKSASRLSGRNQSFLANCGLDALGRALGVGHEQLKAELEAVQWHDWLGDPFSRGAYSYGAVGADGAPEELAQPESDTLFFAGEATDVSGHNGTVHGAIASGYRAAGQILSARANK